MSSSPKNNRQKVAMSKDEQDKMFAKLKLSDRESHCGLPFNGEPEECVICCKKSDLFGVGKCAHPVCMECAIRMFVLGGETTCPQCRSTMEKIYFMETCDGNWLDKQAGHEFLENAETVEYKVVFENDFAKDAYERYMSHPCKICSKGKNRLTMPSFDSLRNHYGQKHRAFFCHICTENLRLFSWERKTYSSEALQMHMKKGDKGDSSMKGHPSCLFCKDRFFDGEHQYRHMRREHFFCQICEQGGDPNKFYRERKELHAHYVHNHFVCVKGECKELGIVFETNLELQVHDARTHSSGNRQVVSVDFQYARHERAGERNRDPARMPPSSARRPTPEAARAPEQPSQLDFPGLGSSQSSSSEQGRTQQEFPSLGRPTVQRGPSASGSRQPIKRSLEERRQVEFPALSSLTSGPSSSAGPSSSSSRPPSLYRPITAPLNRVTRTVTAPTNRQKPVVHKSSAVNGLRNRRYDPFMDERTSPPPPIREVKPKIALVSSLDNREEVGSRPVRHPVVPSATLQSSSHFPSLAGNVPSSSAPKSDWAKLKAGKKKTEMAQKKPIPTPDIWPTLPNYKPQQAAENSLSLKSLSKSLLSGGSASSSSAETTKKAATGVNDNNEGEGKKKRKGKKKGGNNVVVLSLEDIDRRLRMGH